MNSNKGMFVGYVCLGLLTLSVTVWFVSVRNQLIIEDEHINGLWAEIDNQLQRRSDMIPNIVNTVRGYAAYEETVLTALADARSQLSSAATVSDKMDAYNTVEYALTRLLVVVEQYPDLKADKHFIALHDELIGTENRLAVARQRYNRSVSSFNTQLRTFPSSLVGKRFEPRPYFALPDYARQAPQVSF
ncbi:LemA family protein [Pillotina sp. SPG140]